MATLKLSDDFYEPTCSLIAVHCPMEAYRLAYLLNSHLKIRLRRIIGGEADSNVLSEYYEWEDQMEDTVWSLMVNATRRPAASGGSDLFPPGSLTMTSYLIPEMKKVDYFLKIDNTEGTYELEKEIVQKINEIPRVAMAYGVDVNQLKSKQNLIF